MSPWTVIQIDCPRRQIDCPRFHACLDSKHGIASIVGDQASDTKYKGLEEAGSG